MAQTDRMSLAIAEEIGGYAVSPTGTYDDLRFTGESLVLETQSIASNEIRDDRMVSEHVRSMIRAAGSVNFEMSYGSFDKLLEASLFSADWASGDSSGAQTTISFAASSSGLQIISDSGDNFGDITVGQWVRCSGAGSAGNNFIGKVTASAVGEITVTNPNGVVEAAGSSVTIEELDQIVNGVELRSFTAQREYGDLTGDGSFVQFTGLIPDNLNLSIVASQLLTGSIDFVGKTEMSASADIASARTAVNNNQILNTIDHVNGVLIGAAYDSVKVTGFTLQVSNNLRSRTNVGDEGPDSYGYGRSTVAGTIQLYLRNADQYNKYLNWTAETLAVVVQDEANNVYVIDLPRVKLTNGRRVGGGTNQDIIAEYNWASERHTSEDLVIRIARIAA